MQWNAKVPPRSSSGGLPLTQQTPLSSMSRAQYQNQQQQYYPPQNFVNEASQGYHQSDSQQIFNEPRLQVSPSQSSYLSSAETLIPSGTRSSSDDYQNNIPKQYPSYSGYGSGGTRPSRPISSIPGSGSNRFAVITSPEEELKNEIADLQAKENGNNIYYQKLKSIFDYFKQYDDKIEAANQNLEYLIQDTEGMKHHIANVAGPARDGAHQYRADLQEVLVKRSKLTETLKPLINIQEQVEIALIEDTEKEKGIKEETEKTTQSLKDQLTENIEKENGWLRDTLDIAPEMDHWHLERDKRVAILKSEILPEYQRVLDEIQAERDVIETIHVRMRNLGQMIGGMQPTMFAVMKILITKIVEIRKEFKEIQRRLDWEEQISKMQEIADNIEIDKLRPWNSPAFRGWGFQIDLRIRKYVPSQNVSYKLGNMILPFDGVSWQEERQMMRFNFMSNTLPNGQVIIGKAFSKGTYRGARFSQGSDQKFYVIKTFHYRRGIRDIPGQNGEIKNDRDSAEKVSKGNALVSYCARMFTHELAQRGYSQYIVEYLDVHVAECVFLTNESVTYKQSPETCLMIEPLLQGSFKKWVNNK
ncbi:hypothetical protein HK096_010557 [Nowakowskiella sp. JEL0078]|nr:hypothetical protein HK096_010557 [Nowakowskiella sp. JEL0078]